MDMKRDYYEDVQLFSSGVIVFWFCVLIVFLAVFPFIVKNYYVYVANYAPTMKVKRNFVNEAFKDLIESMY